MTAKPMKTLELHYEIMERIKGRNPVLSISFKVDVPTGKVGGSLLFECQRRNIPRGSELEQTRPSTKQDFSGEALSKQNTEASLASLSHTRPGRQPSCPPYLHSVYKAL